MKFPNRTRQDSAQSRPADGRRCGARFATSSEPRHGFTLLEVLLALGLTAALLYAVYEALDLHWRTATIGRVEVERAQLARAILLEIETNIRSVIYQPAPETASATSSTDGATTGTDAETTEETVDPAAAYAGGSAGVVGDKTNLVLHVSKPSRDMNYSSVLDGSSLSSRTSDLQSISYFLAMPGQAGLQGAVGDIAANNGGSRESVAGLARLEGDRLAIELSDSESNLEAMAGKAVVLAREVRQLEFSYFDGLNWLDTWDTLEMGRLPRAIRVTIGFGWSDTELAALKISSDDARIVSRSLVVPLPLSQPYESEEDL